MDRVKIFSQLPSVILPWYNRNKRQLPWREDRQPYHIWLSEIMLQQTRAEAVKRYYLRFLQALPTVEALASADDELLHKLWEGLGYYSRVRNLKKAAVWIMEHGGEFPRDYDGVRGLPGVGPYTAGAICSIAYDLPTPAVDGNVLRVASRLCADTTPIDLPAVKTQVQEGLGQIYPKEAGDFTQALMELGATLCGPNRKPDCENCPCNGFCLGYINGVAQQLPVKSPKKQRRREDRTVFVLSCDGRYALEKRDSTGLLAGLWQFPNVDGRLDITAAFAWVEEKSLKPREIIRQVERKHIFTHIQWDMRGIYIEVAEKTDDYTWLTAQQINQTAALPSAFRQFWEEIF